MDFNTELTKRLLQGDNINHLLKEAIEQGINQLLQSESTEYLNYPKYSVEGYNTGNSRNGSYNRKICSAVSRNHFVCMIVSIHYGFISHYKETFLLVFYTFKHILE